MVLKDWFGGKTELATLMRKRLHVVQSKNFSAEELELPHMDRIGAGVANAFTGQSKRHAEVESKHRYECGGLSHLLRHEKP